MVGGADAADDFSQSGKSFQRASKRYDATTSRSHPPVSPEDAKDDAEFYRSAGANNQGLVAPLGAITRDLEEGTKQGAKGVAQSAVVAGNLDLAGGVFGMAKKLGIERLEGESVLQFEQRVSKAAAESSEKSAAQPYAHLTDPPTVGPGKRATAAQKRNVYQENMAANNGVLRDDVTGEQLVTPTKSRSGVTPPSNEAQVDHVMPRKPKDASVTPGTNSYKNLKVRSRKNNRIKSNNPEQD